MKAEKPRGRMMRYHRKAKRLLPQVPWSEASLLICLFIDRSVSTCDQESMRAVVVALLPEVFHCVWRSRSFLLTKMSSVPRFQFFLFLQKVHRVCPLKQAELSTEAARIHYYYLCFFEKHRSFYRHCASKFLRAIYRNSFE